MINSSNFKYEWIQLFYIEFVSHNSNWILKYKTFLTFLSVSISRMSSASAHIQICRARLLPQTFTTMSMGAPVKVLRPRAPVVEKPPLLRNRAFQQASFQPNVRVSSQSRVDQRGGLLCHVCWSKSLRCFFDFKRFFLCANFSHFAFCYVKMCWKYNFFIRLYTYI